MFSVVLVVLVVALAAGCAIAEEEPSPAPPQGLAKVDPCALLTDAELISSGASVPGYPNDNISWEPGCDFDGDPFGYSVFKNQEMSVAKYETQAEWARYEHRELQGRAAANAIGTGSTKAPVCTILFDAGGGVVIVTALELNDEGRDRCAESWRLAELIAPRLPR